MQISIEDFERALSVWPEPKLADPPGHQSFGVGQDDASPAAGVLLKSNLEGMTIGIIYRDGAGAASERTIRCYMLEKSDGVLYIKAHCKLRNASRTFRMDRIEAVIDYSTGEVIQPIDAFFAPFIEELREIKQTGDVRAPSATKQEGPMLQLYGAGATVLVYLASVDGHLHRAEMSRIERYIDERLSIMKGDPLQRKLSRTWLSNLLPDRDMAVKAMRKVAGNPDDAQLVAEAIVDVIAADGNVSDAEMQAASNMIKILARKERKQARETGS